MRRFALHEIEGRTFDLAIIGGGITGASAAREAALRGLSVVLVEKNDFASGTSSRSTKLLHGGLRYLESHEFKLVREACHERELMLKLAPHLSNVRPFIYVLYEGYPESMRLLSAGLSIYDLFSGNPLKRRHRMLPAARAARLETHLNPTGLVGGGLYYDFLTDDARFTIDTLKGAADAGALVGNYLEVTGLPEENGKVAAVSWSTDINGETRVVRARQVINTAGPWVDAIRFLEDGVGERLLRPTRGVHIVVRRNDFPLKHAVFVRLATRQPRRLADPGAGPGTRLHRHDRHRLRGAAGPRHARPTTTSITCSKSPNFTASRGRRRTRRHIVATIL